MRSYSFFTIILLCISILIIDALAFYWLQSITELIDYPILKEVIYVLFWIFTFGLIISILLLKSRLEDINPRRKQLLTSSLYGLTISSFIPKIIFVIVISILYFANYVFSENESLLFVPLIGLFSGLLPFTVIIYAIFRSLYRFKVHHVDIKFDNLPNSFNNTKIIHISDLHLGSFNYRYHILERAVKLINIQNPDFIFFTGDLVNNYAWELKGWDNILKKLDASIDKYAVLGNHDYGDYSQWNSEKAKHANHDLIKHFYEKIGFKLLLNENYFCKKGDEKISIIGVENWGKPPFKQYGNLNKALPNKEVVNFKILLTHDPSHWNEEVINKTDINLTLSGHTHGMQAGINYKNIMWSPIKYKYKHWAGLYNSGEQYLYVTRGLGWLGFPGRLGMRPEITCIKIHR